MMVKLIQLLLLLLSVGYIEWPGPDLIPDNIPFIGQLDDSAAAMAAFEILRRWLSNAEQKAYDIGYSDGQASGRY